MSGDTNQKSSMPVILAAIMVMTAVGGIFRWLDYKPEKLKPAQFSGAQFSEAALNAALNAAASDPDNVFLVMSTRKDIPNAIALTAMFDSLVMANQYAVLIGGGETIVVPNKNLPELFKRE